MVKAEPQADCGAFKYINKSIPGVSLLYLIVLLRLAWYENVNDCF